MSEHVYILGTGMIRFAKYPDKSMKQLTAEAVASLLQEVPIDVKEIEAAWFSNSGWGSSSEQHCIRGQVALAPLGIEGLPIVNVENACAGGSTAVHQAWTAIKAGLYDVVLAVGAEKVWFPEDKEKMFRSFISGTDVELFTPLLEMMKAEAARKAKEMAPGVKQKEGGRSAFMDVYAMGARLHMDCYGTTQRQLATIAAKNHHHGSLNSLAQYQNDMTVDEVLEDILIAYPLTRSMCAPIGDGAAAALICSERALKRYPQARPVKIRASLLASGARDESNLDPISYRLARQGYEVSGLGPEEISVAELHDATAFGELKQCEELGFCPEGEGGPLAESGATKLGGKIPINTSGGLECRGHPIGASGIAQICELVTQLRGAAGARQVQDARIGLALNGGGFIGLGEAAMCLHIFEKV